MRTESHQECWSGPDQLWTLSRQLFQSTHPPSFPNSALPSLELRSLPPGAEEARSPSRWTSRCCSKGRSSWSRGEAGALHLTGGKEVLPVMWEGWPPSPKDSQPGCWEVSRTTTEVSGKNGL